jgi:hypothetical protein
VGWSLWSSRKSVYTIVINVLDYHYPASLRVSAEAGEAQSVCRSCSGFGSPNARTPRTAKTIRSGRESHSWQGK